MKTSFVSNLAIQNAMRLTIQRGQAEVVKLQEEGTTGVYADVGASLGSSTSRAVDLQTELSRLANIKSTNAVATQRLSTSQLAVTAMREAAEKMHADLISTLNTDDATRIAATKTTNSGTIEAFIGSANAQFNGEYMLSGVNSDAKAMQEYSATSAAKATFDTALSGYMSANGLSSVSAFTADQMSDFIKNTLEPLYTGTQWNADWSGASDTNVMSRISSSEVVTTTTNANEAGVRNFALAAVISTELLDANVSTDVRNTIIVAASDYAQKSITGLIGMSTDLGASENRVKKANTSIEAQTKLLTTNIGDLQGVDPYEAVTRMKALMTQIETSYTLTSRMQQLSLINFL